MELITNSAIKRRNQWIERIVSLSPEFGRGSQHIHRELDEEIEKFGIPVLLDHLRLCSAIPESLPYDSSEEKMYSKYTDLLLEVSFRQLGLESSALQSRGDSADVTARSDKFSFAADAKSFRLSRTARNQKDFKIEAMNRWKGDRDYAMLVCPLYQYPSRSSQIYYQAVQSNVCLFSYSHIAVLLQLSEDLGNIVASNVLHNIFLTIETLNSSGRAISKDAKAYWRQINHTMLEADDSVRGIWDREIKAASHSITIAQRHALDHFNVERARIMQMSRDEAVEEIISLRKIDERTLRVKSVSLDDVVGIC